MIKHSSRLDRSPLLPYVAEAWVELHRINAAPPFEIPFHESYACAWAEELEHPASFIIYRGIELGVAWICIGWTRPEYRRQGLYRAVYGEVRAKVKEAGCSALMGGVQPGAEAMALALDRKLIAGMYEDLL